MYFRNVILRPSGFPSQTDEQAYTQRGGINRSYMVKLFEGFHSWRLSLTSNKKFYDSAINGCTNKFIL